MADTDDVTPGSSSRWRQLIPKWSEIRDPFEKEPPLKAVGAFESPPSYLGLSREHEREWWEAYVDNRVAEERKRVAFGGVMAGATLVVTYHFGWLIFGPVLAFWVGLWYLYFYESRNRFWSAVAWILMTPVLASIALVAVARSCSGAGD